MPFIHINLTMDTKLAARIALLALALIEASALANPLDLGETLYIVQVKINSTENATGKLSGRLLLTFTGDEFEKRIDLNTRLMMQGFTYSLVYRLDVNLLKSDKLTLVFSKFGSEAGQLHVSDLQVIDGEAPDRNSAEEISFCRSNEPKESPTKLPDGVHVTLGLC